MKHVCCLALLALAATAAPAADLLIEHVTVISPEQSQPLTDRSVLIRDCSNIHCFRILVAVALEPFPGPSLVKWKTYAVLANAAAAVAVGQFSLLLGLSARWDNLNVIRRYIHFVAHNDT